MKLYSDLGDVATSKSSLLIEMAPIFEGCDVPDLLEFCDCLTFCANCLQSLFSVFSSSVCDAIMNRNTLRRLCVRFESKVVN